MGRSDPKRPSLPATVAVLRARVDELSALLRKHAAQDVDLVDEVVGHFDQFAGLSGGEDAAKLKRAAFDLAAYLLVNQILFYHLHQRVRGGAQPLPARIASRAALARVLAEMRDGGFGPIYRTDVVARLPATGSTMILLDQIVKDVQGLEPENLKQDLLGRLFHEMLPPTTRKLLAAFYTKPAAADLLARLAVDDPEAMVVDPACGSGTLLVAAYHALTAAGAREAESQLIGLDLMPFAAHLTALNLSVQSMMRASEGAHVASADALSLYEALRARGRTQVPSPNGGVLGINRVALVIMNPPFTDRQKAGTSRAPGGETIASVSGSASNVWCDFMALGDALLQEGGRIAAVIPINLLRGKATATLRRHFLENYSWEYLVKTTNEVGFSEGAIFRDILFVARKGAPRRGHRVRVALLQEPLNDIEAMGDAADVANSILGGESNGAVDVIEFEQGEMQREAGDLMEFIGASTAKNLETLRRTVKALRASKRVTRLSKGKLKEGFGARPQGLGQLVYAMHDNGVASRGRRSILAVKTVTSSQLQVGYIDEHARLKPFKVPASSALPALRNLVGLRTIDAAGTFDYILCENYPTLPAVVRLSAWSGTQRGRGAKDRKRAAKAAPDLSIMTAGASRSLTHLALLHRFDPTTPNSRVIAAWSARKFVPNNNMFAVDLPAEEAKAMALFFNSSFFLAQVLLHKQETTRAMMDFKIAEAQHFAVPDLDAMPRAATTALCAAFDRLSTQELGPLLADYTAGSKVRRAIDDAVGAAIGVRAEGPQAAIGSELSIMKAMMGAGRA